MSPVSTYLSRVRAPIMLATQVALSLMGIGAIALAVGLTTVSSFNATTTNGSNAFATGTLVMTNGGDLTNCATVTGPINCGTLNLSTNAGQLIPGDVATGQVAITNSGSLPSTMALTVSLSSATNSLNTLMNMTIQDDTSGTTTYLYCIYGRAAGTPSSTACDSLKGQASAVSTYALPTLSTAIGPLTLPGASIGTQWAAGESHTYTVTLELASGATTSVQNSAVALTLQWNGSQ